VKEKKEIKKNDKMGVSVEILQQSLKKFIMNNQNELIVEHVNFMGEDVIAVKDPKTNKTYVAVQIVCEKLGFSKKETDSQLLKVITDGVLLKGVELLAGIPCLDVDYIPLWLIKINITPEMKDKNQKEISTLILYQSEVRKSLTPFFTTKFKENYHEQSK